MISLCYVPQMTIEQFILYAAPYQIALNVDCWHIGQMATRSTSQIYERWGSVGFYGICKLMNMNLRVPIMISRLNSALFAAVQIFHPLRVRGRAFYGGYPLKNPQNSDKIQTGRAYHEVLTHLSSLFSTTTTSA